MPDEHSQVTDLQAFIGVEEGSLESPLSAEKKAEIFRFVQSSISHSGPLPSPETLAAYEKVLPGAAERIVRMAEAQSTHRHAMEKAVITGNVVAQSRGLWLGFIVALVAFLYAFYLASQGKQLEGVGVFLCDLAGLVSVFLYGKTLQRNELQEKRMPDDSTDV